LNPVHRCAALTLALLAFAPAATAAAAPAGARLADSTVVERWTLPNGLDVVTHHVPGARAVSVAWGYRLGLDADPADLPGWTSLLAEVAFTAPAGGTPDRTRAEMESLRPLGWSLRVTRRHTLFTETAAPAQLPGVLHQVAERMRGVEVTPAALRAAVATVRAALEERSRGVTEPMLYWQARQHARGTGPDELVQRAGGRGLERVRPEAVRRALERAYVPANGVLVLAGDLSGLDARAVLADRFGGLPARPRPPEPPAAALTAATVAVQRAGLERPVGVAGLFAPALADSSHPAFALAMLMLGTQAKATWEPPDPPLETRFQYALLDDPGFVRFYPPLRPGDEANPGSPSVRLDTLVIDVVDTQILPHFYADLRASMVWLLGGPLPEALQRGMRADPAALNVLATTTAARALWGDEDFWRGYRERFAAGPAATPAHWNRWLRDPRNRASLLVTPPR
jgi:hypothetical protein